MTQGSSNTAPAPRLAFLGFCERAETVTEGNVVFWKQNLLGVSLSRAFYVFPANLRGMSIAMAVYQPKAGDSFKLVFRGTQGQTSFDLVMQIASAVRSDTEADSKVTETRITTGVVDPGWVFLANQINSDIVVNSAGTYEVFLASENEEQYLGLVTMAHVPVAPYTPEEITALKSDPLATKFVRMDLKCNSCHEGVKAYAGVERSPLLESQGFQWNLDIKEDEFVCSCGKGRISLGSYQDGSTWTSATKCEPPNADRRLCRPTL